MTSSWVELRAEDGTWIPFETDSGDYDGPVQAGRGVDAVLDRATESLEAGVDQAKRVAHAVITRLGSLPAPKPSKLVVEIGLKVSADAGVVIAKASADAHIKITMEWQRGTAEPASPDDDDDDSDNQP
jgi:hypothetical protein